MVGAVKVSPGGRLLVFSSATWLERPSVPAAGQVRLGVGALLPLGGRSALQYAALPFLASAARYRQRAGTGWLAHPMHRPTNAPFRNTTTVRHCTRFMHITVASTGVLQLDRSLLSLISKFSLSQSPGRTGQR